MAVLGGIGLNVIASIVFAVLGFTVAKIYDTYRKRRALGHVYALLSSSKRITVVFPPDTATSAIGGRLDNAVRMSLVEGAAIARVGQICRDTRPGTEMYLIHPDDHHVNRGSFFMIGDPANSKWAKEWIAKNFRELQFDPEKRRLDYDGASWETRIDKNAATLDFGFIVVGRTEASIPFVLLWGASEFGTNIAARAYSDLHRQISSERYRRVLAGEPWLFVARADIDKYGVRTDDVGNVNVVAAYRAHNSMTRDW